MPPSGDGFLLVSHLDASATPWVVDIGSTQSRQGCASSNEMQIQRVIEASRTF